jgi:hypothetical protein
MQQIADWLEKLGMSEYAERFAENDVDIAVLRHLTDQDHKELGVSLGHRRKMPAAIAEHADTLTASPPARVGNGMAAAACSPMRRRQSTIKDRLRGGRTIAYSSEGQRDPLRVIGARLMFFRRVFQFGGHL